MDFENLQADVEKILTKHYSLGRGGHTIDKVVIHYNAANLTVEQCYSVWQTREASAHYQVEDGGRIGQLVHDWDTAWHAGNFAVNQSSIGIEHANRADGTISEKCLDAGAHLTAAICKFYGLGAPAWGVNVFPHKHFSATACPGQIYGSQKNAYIKRAQKWYAAMNGGSTPKPKPKPKPEPKPKPKGKIDVDGYWGRDTTLGAQKVFGTIPDGEVSSQSNYWRGKFLACTTGWRWVAPKYAEGSQLITAMQKWMKDAGHYHGEIDGLAGRNFWRGLESMAGYSPDEKGLEAPSNTVKWLQRYINDKL